MAAAAGGALESKKPAPRRGLASLYLLLMAVFFAGVAGNVLAIMGLVVRPWSTGSASPRWISARGVIGEGGYVCGGSFDPVR